MRLDLCAACQLRHLGLMPGGLLCRAQSATDLMYIKEDLILPKTLTFYELIATRARGKSGPLFHFDVHEDLRLQSDARVEKDESHAGGSRAPLCLLVVLGLRMSHLPHALLTMACKYAWPEA